ncbi:MAG: hypothetical protein Q8P26_00100 [Candidatus Levybacteria bacterium]|nr:hypothetical protein [Candidatus Levybacteria bacterium]MDZ4228069.1 hypothetical protein [Candidatus Levybacteria bacterium]
MQKLIPTIYFYLLSAAGMVLLIIGLFNAVHYVTGITAYDKYPLRFGAESRCDYMPKAIPAEGERDAKPDTTKEDCLKSLEKERQTTKADDLEKSISFTAIGLLIFGIHFYFARQQRKA